MWLVQLPENTSDIDLDLSSIQDTRIPNTNDPAFIDLAHRLIALGFIIGGFFTLVFLLWGGIQYIISGGKEEKVKKAGNTIRNAFIGLVIIILSFTAVQLVGNAFGFDLIPYLSFERIVSNVNTFTPRL